MALNGYRISHHSLDRWTSKEKVIYSQVSASQKIISIWNKDTLQIFRVGTFNWGCSADVCVGGYSTQLTWRSCHGSPKIKLEHLPGADMRNTTWREENQHIVERSRPPLFGMRLDRRFLPLKWGYFSQVLLSFLVATGLGPWRAGIELPMMGWTTVK